MQGHADTLIANRERDPNSRILCLVNRAPKAPCRTSAAHPNGLAV